MPGATLPACKIPARLALAAKPFRLTRRELQVLTLAATGEAVKMIAARLGISSRTVDFHREHICAKIGQPNLLAAVFTILF